MKLNNIILIILISLSLSLCEFINSEYIKDLTSISEFDNQLINSNITMGMMLIYSTSCGHCHGFLPTYEKLAQKYHSRLHFFAMNVYSDYHKKIPRTYGVPYILFFHDDYFYKHQRRRSYEEIEYTIENIIFSRCRDITYKNIDNVYHNIFLKDKKYNNLIIGFFDANSKDEIKNFREENKKMCEECVGLCYICKDFGENNDKKNNLFKYVKSNIIVGYLRNNNSKIFLWDNEDGITNNYSSYEEFINEDLKSNYINLNEENKKYLIDFLRIKNSIIFSYETTYEKIEFEKNIDEIINITNNKVYSNYNLVLYNFTNFKENIFSFINESGLYETTGELNFKSKFNNFTQLKNKFIKEYNNTSNNFTKNNELLIPEVKKDKNDNENGEDEQYNIFNDDYFFEVLEKICVILFSIVITLAMFFILHNTFYKNVDMELVNYYSKK